MVVSLSSYTGYQQKIMLYLSGSMWLCGYLWLYQVKSGLQARRVEIYMPVNTVAAGGRLLQPDSPSLLFRWWPQSWEISKDLSQRCCKNVPKN